MEELHAGGFGPLTSTLVIVAAGLRARIPHHWLRGRRSDGALRESSAVEERQDAAADPERDAVLPTCDGPQPEQLAQEALDGVSARGVAKSTVSSTPTSLGCA